MEDTVFSATEKARQVRSNIKSMLVIFFFDIRGIVHKVFVPPGQTVSGNFYCEVLRLRENVRRKRPEMCMETLAPRQCATHISLLVREFLTKKKNNMTIVPQPCLPT